MKKLFFKTLLFFILTIISIETFAQEKIQIPTTNLYIQLKDGFELAKESGTINAPNYCLSFMEMADLNFENEKSDFDNIETQYLEKNIVVKQKKSKKIGNYEAIVISLDVTPDILQIFLGNNQFCTFINIIASDSIPINEQEIEVFLKTLEYIPSSKTPIEEHANFKFVDDKHDWEFVHYAASTFGFQNEKTQDMMMILQLPSSPALFESKKSFADEMLNKYRENFDTCEVLRSEEWAADYIEGYRMLIEVTRDKKKAGFMYLFIFGKNENVFIFQGVAKEFDESKVALFNQTINKLDFKL